MADKDYYAFQVPKSRLGRRNWRLRSSSQKVTCIVMHTTEGHPDRKGVDSGAEACAKYFSKTKRAASSHPVVDSDSTIFYLPSRYMAWHCKGLNARSVGIEMATQAGKWAWLLEHAHEWSYDLLWRTARVAAGYCLTYDIPAVQISASDAKRGVKGFLGHGQADPKRRTDPGRDFPWEFFLHMVHAIKEGKTTCIGLTAKGLRHLQEKHGAGPEFEPDSVGKVTRSSVNRAVKKQATKSAAVAAGVFKGMDKKVAQIEQSVKDNIATIRKHSTQLDELNDQFDDMADEISDLTRELAKVHKRLKELEGKSGQVIQTNPQYDATEWQQPAAKPAVSSGNDIPEVQAKVTRKKADDPESLPESHWVAQPFKKFGRGHPQGLRMHNPGNLRYGGVNWRGLRAKPEHNWSFCDFVHPYYGIRAASRNARSQVRKGHDTPRKLFAVWAPKGDGDNDPDSYARYVAKKMNISIDTPLKESLDVWINLIKAIAQLENSASKDAYDWYDKDMFRAAVWSGLS